MNNRDLTNTTIAFSNGLSKWKDILNKQGDRLREFFILLSLVFTNVFFTNLAFSQTPETALSNVVQVSGGGSYFCALISTNGYLDERARGSVKCWGANNYGQLGDGTNKQLSSVPVDVLVTGTTSLLTDVKYISAGVSHVCAIVEKASEDEVWCWGYNYYGQLGNNSNVTSRKAVKVLFAGSHRFLKLSASGYYHVVALTNTGNVYAWGFNNFGQLGDGTTTRSQVPVIVKRSLAPDENLSNIVDIATAGASTTCAIGSDTNIYCWGNGIHGYLGNGVYTSNNSINPLPSLATALGSGHAKIYGNGSVNLFTSLKNNNQVAVWGMNRQMVPVKSDIKDIAASGGSGAPIFLTLDGRVLNSDDTEIAFPENTNIIDLEESNGSYAAITEDGWLYAWGNNNSGELANGDYVTSPYPKLATLPNDYYLRNSTPKKIFAGQSSTILLTNESKGIAFGSFCETISRAIYVKGFEGVGELSNIKGAGAGQSPCFKIGEEEELNHAVCFGCGTYGELGNDGGISYSYPVYAKGIGGETQKLEGHISRQSSHTGSCVILSGDEGKIACWGRNMYGQLGNQEFGFRNRPNEKGEISTSDRRSAVPVLVQDRASYLDPENPLKGALSVSKGSRHTCALMNDKTVKCWGNSEYYLGNQTDDNNVKGSLRPATIIVDNDATPLSNVKEIAAAGSNNATIALKEDGTVVAFGNTNRRPVAVAGLTNVKKIAAGDSHYCAIVEETGRNILKCWGSNTYGQLGNGTFTNSNTIPVTVIGPNGEDKLINVSDVGCGSGHTCAIAHNQVYCWGSDNYGQTGKPDYIVPAPELVPRPYEISGLVLAADGMTPISGATISADTLGGMITVANGRYSIMAPYGKPYAIKVKKSGLSFKVQGEEESVLSGVVRGARTANFLAQGLCADGGTPQVDCVTCRDDLDCEPHFHCENAGLVASTCEADPPPCSSDAVFPAYEDLGNVCSVGKGACASQGVYICDGESHSSEVVCNAEINWDAQGVEICDEIDNDCDGLTDEGIDEDGDGANDCEEECPEDPLRTEEGVCGCNFTDLAGDPKRDTDSCKIGEIAGVPIYDICNGDYDQDGIVNCKDGVIDPLPSPTPTPSITSTPVETPSVTSTPTVSPTPTSDEECFNLALRVSVKRRRTTIKMNKVNVAALRRSCLQPEFPRNYTIQTCF